MPVSCRKRGSARIKRKSVKSTKSASASRRKSVRRSGSRRRSMRKSPRKASGRRKSVRASLTKLTKHVKSLEAHVEKTHRPGVSKKVHDKDIASHKRKYHGQNAVAGVAAATGAQENQQVDEARQSMGYYFADLAVYYAKMAKLFSDK